jgi:hypothetical protein
VEDELELGEQVRSSSVLGGFLEGRDSRVCGVEILFEGGALGEGGLHERREGVGVFPFFLQVLAQHGRFGARGDEALRVVVGLRGGLGVRDVVGFGLGLERLVALEELVEGEEETALLLLGVQGLQG